MSNNNETIIKVKPKFVDLISNPDGSLSTKRTAGWITMFFTFFLIYKGNVDFDILFLLMGFVLGAFGLTTTENIAYFNNLGKKSNIPTPNNQPNYNNFPDYNQPYNYNNPYISNNPGNMVNNPNNYNPFPNNDMSKPMMP